MSKKILLIESDTAFATELTEALEGKRFTVRQTGDGKEGLELAKEEHPDAVVLCVELPKMSGYSICNKLKKDDGLKGIPLVIISAEATPETFEQHKKLKTRAEEYLIKPFQPDALLEKLSALIGLPEGAEEEEVVQLDEADAALEALGEADVEPIEEVDESTTIAAAPKGPDEDEDLKMLDDAFDGLSDEKPAEHEEVSLDVDTEKPVEDEEVGAALETLPEGDEPHEAVDVASDDADAALDSLGGDAGEAPRAEDMGFTGVAGEMSGVHGVAEYMARIAELEEKLSQKTAEVEQAKAAGATASGSSKETLQLKAAINNKDKEILRLKQDLNEKETELLEIKEKETELETKAASFDDEIRRRDGEIKSLKSKMDGFVNASKKLENELKNTRDEARRNAEKAGNAEKELGSLRARIDELERTAAEKGAEAADAAGKAEALEKELETLRGDLDTARNEADQMRGELESLRAEQEGKVGELQTRVAELESANNKNEERVVKAYQKIKGDEKLREKTKKALAIALQLLEEHPGDGSPEKDVRP